MKFKLLISALALSFATMGVHAGEAEDAIAAAKKARKDAAAAGYEWRDMKKMVEKAEAAAKEGKTKKAIKIANTVVMHGKAALKQAEEAKSAGPRF